MGEEPLRVGVIGLGYVGLVTAACLAEMGNHLTCVDSDEEKVGALLAGRVPIYEPGLQEMVGRNLAGGRLRFTTSVRDAVEPSDVLFLTVGTPARDDGSADLSAVESVAREVAAHLNDFKIIVEKSTVPVNTGERVKRTIQRGNKRGVDFEVVSNPEFLREGSAIEDFLSPDRIVVGVESERAAEIMRRLYRPVLEGRFLKPGSARPPELVVTDVRSAELIKHASNSFLALKISFINAIAGICEQAGADVEDVARGVGLDSRIGPQFLHAGLGYGGSCFPKDLAAFYEISRDLGYDFSLLREVIAINAEQRRRFLRKVEEALWVVKGKLVGVLGLAFKPGTDDIREAPALEVLRWLEKEGARVKAYDPAAMENVRRLYPDVTYCPSPYEAAQGADALLFLTEWDEFASLDLARLHSLMNHAIIVDGRNIFSAQAMAEAGFEYYSLGRPAQGARARTGAR